jgi:hypothetical protein
MLLMCRMMAPPLKVTGSLVAWSKLFLCDLETFILFQCASLFIPQDICYKPSSNDGLSCTHIRLNSPMPWIVFFWCCSFW